MGKKGKDRIKRTKKRLHQLVTDPEAALDDLDKHMRKTIGGPLQSTKKSIDKTQKTVSNAFTTLVTNAGNLINFPRREYEAGKAAAVEVGMTVGDIVENIWDQQEPEVEVVHVRPEFADYITLASKDPKNLTHDEWVAFISMISQKLESQLRFRLDIRKEEKYNLIHLLKMADEDEVIKPNESTRLHKFRMNERNPIVHAQKDEVDKYDLVIWVAKFVRNLEEEKITEIKENTEGIEQNTY